MPWALTGPRGCWINRWKKKKKINSRLPNIQNCFHLTNSLQLQTTWGRKSFMENFKVRQAVLGQSNDSYSPIFGLHQWQKAMRKCCFRRSCIIPKGYLFFCTVRMLGYTIGLTTRDILPLLKSHLQKESLSSCAEGADRRVSHMFIGIFWEKN